MHLVRLPLALAIVAAVPPATAQVNCGESAGFTLPDRDGSVQRPVRRVNGAIVFTSGLRVNTDGAANSYHPVGTSKGALNTICNGIAIIPRTGRWAGRRITAKAPSVIPGQARCQMILDAFRKSRDAGYAIDPDMTIDWYALAMRPPENGRYKPCIQEAGAFLGFFVAQTSRAADPTKDVCDPLHWISATEIPYLTLPGQRLAIHGVAPGDVALVHRKVNGDGRFVVAVAGDTGNANELGEGSIALHRALGNTPTARIPGNITDGVTTFIFPGRRAARPITAQALESEREVLIGLLGGQERALVCVR